MHMSDWHQLLKVGQEVDCINDVLHPHVIGALSSPHVAAGFLAVFMLVNGVIKLNILYLLTVFHAELSRHVMII